MKIQSRLHRSVLLAAMLCLTATLTVDAFIRPIESETPSKQSPHAVERFVRMTEIIDSVGADDLIGENVWWRLIEEHREKIEQARTHREFAAAVNQLLDSTNQSHFRYFYEDEWSFWLMRSYFFRGDEDARLEHVGLYAQALDGRWFVRGILEGTEAQDSRIGIGDEIVSVDGAPFHPVLSFRGKAGEPVELLLKRTEDSAYRVTLTPVRESLYRAMQRAIRKSIRVIEENGIRMAYMHGWTLLGPGGEYDLLAELEPEVDGLLLDYRDGVGGTPFNARRFLLGSRRTEGWTKPVVILTADGTRSAKEIVVDAVKDEGRALLVGSPTPGHVTSCIARRVGVDGVLLLPLRKLELEGIPTTPDVYVKRNLPYCQGYDPQLKIGKLALQEMVQEQRTAILSN